jgi:hypothetical protein
LVEPGTYRLAPGRSLLGFPTAKMTVVISGRSYSVPFPRQILRLNQYRVKPDKVLAVGILEAKLLPALDGRAPEIRVRLDDSAQARRGLVQEEIRQMMDPARSSDARDGAVSWSRGLQNSLMDILAEEDHQPLYQPAP